MSTRAARLRSISAPMCSLICFSAYHHGRGRLYTVHDFDHMYFPQDWYQVYDQLGDGCEIEFPVRMCSNVKWSRTINRSDIGVRPKPKHYTEVCTLWILKLNCTLPVVYTIYHTLQYNDNDSNPNVTCRNVQMVYGDMNCTHHAEREKVVHNTCR